MVKNRRARCDDDDDEDSSSSSSCSLNSIEDRASLSDVEERRKKRKKKKRIPARSKQSYLSDSDLESESRSNEVCQNDSIQPAGGYCAKKKKKKVCHPVDSDYAFPNRTQIYKQIVGDYPRRILLHLFTTLILYYFMYPFVNCFWSYIISINEEMATLFEYIVEEPVHETTLVEHFQRFRWLRWPPITSASVTLLLAATIKDHVFLHWENALDDVSISSLMSR